MQTSNNRPNRSYTSNKSYNNPTAKEPELPRSYLSNLFKPPTDAREAEIERARLYGREPRNTNIKGSFSIK